MTSKSLKYRLRKHLDNALYTKHNKHLCNWILKILKSDNLPIIEEIETCNTENWQDREKYHISIGENLLNSTDGGEGTFGFKHSEESKMKMKLSLKDRKFPSRETLLKRSKSLKGIPRTEEWKRKIADANRGKIYTKFKILVKDTLLDIETIHDSVDKVVENYPFSPMSVRRNLSNNKLIKKRYLLQKINKG